VNAHKSALGHVDIQSPNTFGTTSIIQRERLQYQLFRRVLSSSYQCYLLVCVNQRDAVAVAQDVQRKTEETKDYRTENYINKFILYCMNLD